MAHLVAFVIALLVVPTAARAGSFRWQAFDGTRVEAELVAAPDEPAQLVVTRPAAAQVELPGAVPGDDLRIHGIDDDLVVVGADRAWRLGWKRGQFFLIASAHWTSPRRRPGWARPRDGRGFRSLYQLMRFEDSLPGLERIFTDELVTVYRNFRTPTKLAGSELLARWRATGFPLVRGLRKGAEPGCDSLPVNSFAFVKAEQDPSGPLLEAACFAKGRLTRIYLKLP